MVRASTDDPVSLATFLLVRIPLNSSHSFHPAATNWIGLRKLQELDLADNRLTELPVLFLHAFKSLAYLNVSRNNLKSFPDPWSCPLVCTMKTTSGSVSLWTPRHECQSTLRPRRGPWHQFVWLRI